MGIERAYGVERRGEFWHQGAALRSEVEAGILPLQQRHPEMLLQPSDLMADGALRHAEFGGRAGEGAVAHDGVEGEQGLKRRQMSGHDTP